MSFVKVKIEKQKPLQEYYKTLLETMQKRKFNGNGDHLQAKWRRLPISRITMIISKHNDGDHLQAAEKR